MKIIKKYENRCLYDAELSANITLQDLKAYVMDSVPFKVVNAKTDEDITRSYLIQIILELEAMDNRLFSEESLAHLIRFYGHPMQDRIRMFLQQSLDNIRLWQDMFVSAQKK